MVEGVQEAEEGVPEGCRPQVPSLLVLSTTLNHSAP